MADAKVSVDGVLMSRSYLRNRDRKHFADVFPTLRSSAATLKSAFQNEYQSYLNSEKVIATNPESMGLRNEEEEQSIADFLRHCPAGKVALRHRYRKFYFGEAHRFDLPESKWTVEEAIPASIDNQEMMDLGRNHPESLKYMNGMTNWMSFIQALMGDVGSVGIASAELKLRDYLKESAEKLLSSK